MTEATHLTLEALQAGLDEVRRSPKDRGTLALIAGEHARHESPAQPNGLNLRIKGWVEPASGVEPPTYGLRNRCSASELRRHGAPHSTQAVLWFQLGTRIAGEILHFVQNDVAGVKGRRLYV